MVEVRIHLARFIQLGFYIDIFVHYYIMEAFKVNFGVNRIDSESVLTQGIVSLLGNILTSSLLV